MSRDITRGSTPKNFAIQGHPPIYSHEYVMAGGGYVDSAFAPPPRRWHSRVANPRAADPRVADPRVADPRVADPRVADPTSTGADVVSELKIPQKTGLHLYEISNSDWDAATRFVANLAENVRYTRKVHGDRVLPADEVAKWNDFWRRWLIFANKMEGVGRKFSDESLVAQALAATNPLYWASRSLFTTARGMLALMSTENKRELDALLAEAWKLHERFRLLGMSQVAVPYMGELVILIRTLPKEITLSEIATRLRDGARAGERLLDANTAWWQWRKRDESRGLRRAIEDARELATEVERVSKTDAGRGLRDTSTPVYQHFVRIMAKIYVEAAGLYGVEETRTSARAEAKDEAHRGAERAGISLGWLITTLGVGYIGLRWLTNPSTKIVVENVHPGYHPGNDNLTKEHRETEEGD